jgi:myo-inositol-1-phosphate synthase
MGKVRIAIAGVGNCASSLVQGLEYYRDADDGARVPGLMHVRFGPYHISDVEVVAAFDVDAKKVGCDLADAIYASENNTIKIAEVPPTGVTVQRGPTLDGLGEYYREIITESDEPAADVAQVLRETGADVLVSYLPVGSEQADRYYAQCAIDAHVAFVNALPVFIASDPQWAARFTEAGVPIIGDDIKSQVGATITHRVLAKLFEDRGVELLRTYQLNFGGNMDFMNMLERKRLQSKKISKTQAVTSQIPHEMEARRGAHRPVRPRAVAGRQEDGLRPARGPRLRRRAAQPGVQARGVGLAQLGRRHHRRGARGEDRPGPGHRRAGDLGQLVLHEVAAGAVRRRRLPGPGRAVHPRRSRPITSAGRAP